MQNAGKPKKTLGSIRPPDINNPKESVEQQHFVQYVEWRGYPIFAIPNGWHVSGANPEKVSIAIHKLRQEGLRNGVPDLFIPVPAGNKHGLFIEMKRRKGGKVTGEQTRWLKLLSQYGYVAVVANGFEEAKKTFDEYIKSGERKSDA